MANQQDINGIINAIKSYMNTLNSICDAEQKQEVLLDLASDLFNDVLMPNKPYKGTVWVVYFTNPYNSPETEIYGCYSSESAANKAEAELEQQITENGYDNVQILTVSYSVLD